MAEACHTFETPVTGGNVSFYNQTNIDNTQQPIFPTPTIAMVGIIENLQKRTSISFKKEQDFIFLLGKPVEDLAASQYLVHLLKIKATPAPYFNLDEELKLHNLLRQLIAGQKLNSAHDISEGGLIITLFEKSFQNKLGFEITTPSNHRKDAFLFGEAQGRAVVSVSESQLTSFQNTLQDQKVPHLLLGRVTKNEIKVNGENWGKIDDFQKRYENTLPNLMD